MTVSPTRFGRLVLASESPARLALLRNAGLDPEVAASGVDETGMVGTAAEVTLELARRKAQAVADRYDDALVIACDSLLDFDGEALGRPVDAADAVARWQRMRGRTGTLVTGHCVIHSRSGREKCDVAATDVRFGSPTDAEIAAYVDQGEPLRVAGAFTLDGLGSWFIEGVQGNPSNVVGLSLPLLRWLLADLGIRVTDLWRQGSAADPGGVGRP